MKNICFALIFLLIILGSICNGQTILYDNWPTTVNSNAPDSSKLKINVSPNFVPIGTTWGHRIITYFFQNGTGDMTGTTEHQAVRDAMAFWTNETDIYFLQVCTAAAADISIGWAAGAHGDPNPNGVFPPPGDFDGINGVLAHTLGGPPPNVFGAMAGDLHFDEDETWTNALRGNGVQPIDLLTVAAHELGHVLGLNHTTVAGSLMLANYTQSHRFLGTDDIAGIKSLYGNPQANVPITGPNLICTTGTFTISGVPTGVTIAWSTSNPSGLSINSSGNATRIGFFSGVVDVIATLSTACGSTQVVKRKIYVGAPTYVMSINGINTNSASVIAGGNYPLNATTLSPGTTSYTYTNSGGSGNMSTSLTPTGSYAYVYVNTSSTSGHREITVSGTNTCGTLNQMVYLNLTSSFLAYPNPASSELIVSLPDAHSKESLPTRLELFKENSTNSVLSIIPSQYYDKQMLIDGNKIKIDIRPLERGTYYLHLYNNSKQNSAIEKIRIILE